MLKASTDATVPPTHSWISPATKGYTEMGFIDVCFAVDVFDFDQLATCPENVGYIRCGSATSIIFDQSAHAETKTPCRSQHGFKINHRG